MLVFTIDDIICLVLLAIFIIIGLLLLFIYGMSNLIEKLQKRSEKYYRKEHKEDEEN